MREVSARPAIVQSFNGRDDLLDKLRAAARWDVPKTESAWYREGASDIRAFANEVVMPFRHILVPVDLDDTSTHAVDQALALAKPLEAAVTLLHVYSLPTYNFPDGSYVPSPDVMAGLQKSAREHLEAYIAKLHNPGIVISSHVREGRTAEEICKAAIEVGADLIVMGTHGRSLLGRTILGSVAESVVRRTPIPVMTVHTG